jgi:Ni/Co efflux regulator RcnB
MRKFLIAVLLASAAATPAAAQNVQEQKRATRVEGKQAHEVRKNRTAPTANVTRSRTVKVQRNIQVAQPRQEVRRINNEVRRRPPVVSQTPRFGTQPPLRVQKRPRPQPNWTTNWRNNNRYDWNDWRRRHGNSYRLRRYHDPFNWGYQLFSIGWRLWPAYYGSAYWINDPWMYRLPPAPAGTRWIRYYNDVLLVDMYTGEVIDVIHNFFW